MRLMLGNNTTPALLVTVDEKFNPTDFEFNVINGNWKGKMFNGHITVFGSPDGDFTSLESMQILCDEQHRLRGYWPTVFDNFADETYLAPERRYIPPPELDDAIPF